MAEAEADIEIVGETGSAEEALSRIPPTKQADQGNGSRRLRTASRRRAVPARPRVTERVLERLRSGNETNDQLAQLTDQERRILDLIAEGLTNRQIADRVHLAEKTVKNYVSNLLMKLGMERRTQAAVFAAGLRDRPGTDERE